MTDSSANKRIAKNTIFIYVRLFITMFIGLYTSRIVLLTLGISDFGLYSIVGGVLTMFTFISASLMSATSRFFNVELGKPDGDINRSFNVNFVLHLALAVIIFILAETIGIWYIYNKLNLEPGKFGDAMFVYQVAIITSCIGLINEPYASLFQAFERFGFLAAFDVANTIIKLVLVILLQYYDGSALRFYCIIMSLTTLNAFVVYHWIAARDWAYIIKLKFVRGWNNYKEVVVFSSWNILATVAMMARITGSDLIINSFFGTAVNGAFAVSKTVNNYIMSFSSNFDTASGPQIIQTFGTGDNDRCNYLVNKLGRFSLLLFILIFFPLYIELDFILHLWLKKVPDGVLLFCQLNLLLAAVSLTCGGIMQVISASGKIKWFKIVGGIIAFVCVLSGYLLIQNGAPAYTMIVVFIVADVVNRIIQLALMKFIIGFNSWRYVREAYLRPFVIALIMSICLYIYSLLALDNMVLKLLAIMGCLGITSTLVFTIGMTSGEKNKLLAFVKNKIR
jgi:O-antigen/teichoic acid export membrane protein